MKVLVELELNVSDWGLTPEQVADVVRRAVGLVLDTLTHPGEGQVAQILEARIAEITPLLASTIADKARTLLGRIAKQALNEIPELRAVVCLPLWGMESPDLPLSQVFVPKNSQLDFVALKVALAAQLAIVLNQTVSTFPEMVHNAQQVVREAAQQAAQAQQQTGKP